MRAFIAFCVLITGLVSVICDRSVEDQTLINKIAAMYANMTEDEIKMHATDNVKAIEQIMNGTAQSYMKQDLTLAATHELDVIKFYDEGLPKAFADLDKMESKLKHRTYIEFGVTIAFLRTKYEDRAKKEAGLEVKVLDTEENLLKKYKELYNKILATLKWAAEDEKKLPEKVFWAHLHQAIYNSLAPGLSKIETAVEHLPQATRAKNLQALVNGLNYTLEVANRPKSFSAQVKERVYEMAAKVKQFFAKIF